MADDGAGSTVSEHLKEPRDGNSSSVDEMTKDRKRNKTRGMLGWLKMKVGSNLLDPSVVSKFIGGVSHCGLILRMTQSKYIYFIHLIVILDCFGKYMTHNVYAAEI